MTADYNEILKCVDREGYEGVFLWCINISPSVHLHASKIKYCVCNINILTGLTNFVFQPFTPQYITSKRIFFLSKQRIYVLLLLLHLFIVRKISSVFPFFTLVIVIHLPHSYKFYKKNCVVTDYNHNISAERNTLALYTTSTSSANLHFNIRLQKITIILQYYLNFFKILIYRFYKTFRLYF